MHEPSSLLLSPSTPLIVSLRSDIDTSSIVAQIAKAEEKLEEVLSFHFYDSSERKKRKYSNLNRKLDNFQMRRKRALLQMENERVDEQLEIMREAAEKLGLKVERKEEEENDENTFVEEDSQ